ncbi:MAG: acetyl-CoA carboxylase biotin carboxylase subunit family protein [Oligoflexales bacterium]
MLKILMICITLCLPFFSSVSHSQNNNPLHVLMIDACFLPDHFELFKNQKIIVELMTSASPVLQYVHSPKPCVEQYENAVKPHGEVLNVHSHFFGDSLSQLNKIRRYTDKIINKRGAFDLVISNNSDLATYVAQDLRAHLNMLPHSRKWDIESSDRFYDKYIMKKTLTANDSSIYTAAFIDLSSPREEIDAFLKENHFPHNSIVLKKKRSAGAVGVEIIHTRRDFERKYRKIKELDHYLIERFIDGSSFRFNGFVTNDTIPIVISALHRTSPLDHYQGGKSRITTTLDEDLIKKENVQEFTTRVLKALGMKSGTFHLEGILSNIDNKMYFVEIAARPGEGNVEEVYNTTYGYDPKNTFFYQQTPEGFYTNEEEKLMDSRFFENTHESQGQVFANLVYPYLDANRFTFQHIQTNLSQNLKNGHPDFPTFQGCVFEKSFESLNEEKLENSGLSIIRLTFQAGLKAVACRFQGSREDVDHDLNLFQQRYYFKAKKNHTLINSLVPRSLFKAGGV